MVSQSIGHLLSNVNVFGRGVSRSVTEGIMNNRSVVSNRSVTSVNVVCCCELVNGLIKSVSLDVHVVVRSAIVISVLA